MVLHFRLAVCGQGNVAKMGINGVNNSFLTQFCTKYDIEVYSDITRIL